MRIKTNQITVLVFFFGFIFGLAGCATFMMKDSASEAVVLSDGTEIPCEILEIGDDVIVFEALNSKDRYTYGEELPRGEIRAIRLFDGRSVSYVSVNEYLEIKDDEFGEPVSGSEAREPGAVSSGEQDVQSSVLDDEFRKISQSNPPSSSPPASPQASGNERPGLRLSDLTFPDSTGRGRGTGLQIPPFQSSQAGSGAEISYAEIARLVIASGAAGLVMYRAEKLSSQGVAVTDSQNELIVSIRNSELWKTRKSGLIEAHRTASEAFKASLEHARYTLGDKIGFRPRNERIDDFVEFMLYLKMNGGLASSAKKRFMKEWFGEVATTATVDLLANFDDWYYLFVIRDN